MSCTTTIEQRLRERGLRVTEQRRRLATALKHAGTHATIEELQQHIEREFGPPAVPTPTAYRTIEVLKQHGFVSEITSDQGSSRFEWIDAERPHHHLRCALCGNDEQVEVDAGGPSAVERVVVGERGFEPFTQHFVLTGICSNCAEVRARSQALETTE